MTNTDTDGDKYVINGVEVTPVEAIEIITAFFKKQQFRVGRLKARITELEAENNRLAELLHNELSSVEIATDLGNKRWVALNDIYENGEKHNANWCKRKAQEGLGIK